MKSPSPQSPLAGFARLGQAPLPAFDGASRGRGKITRGFQTLFGHCEPAFNGRGHLFFLGLFAEIASLRSQ
jgi:hypothetical protein